MTAAVPLVDASRTTPFARRGATEISVGRFVGDVHALAASLPGSGHVLNVCVDRYRFAVGLAAALCRGQVSVLPATTQPATIRQLTAELPDVYCLAESPQPAIDLRQALYDDDALAAAPPRTDVPAIPAERVAAFVFTSGSTGTPTRHVKRWGPIAASARVEAARLYAFADRRPSESLSVVATVPPQHMYGLESTVLIALQSAATLVAERPFYPADIVATLERSPAPRMLVTTPFHLRALLAEASTLPAVALVLSATAPLSGELARESEARFGAPIAEIYGCTETGQLATRRPTVDTCWTLFDGVELAVDDDDGAIASGGHVERPTRLVDRLALADDYAATHRFALVGRTHDVVNIAGKRTSLGWLDTQLAAIEGVVDGAFFQPDDDAAARDGVSRLGAVVVAPTLTAATLVAKLRERIDPAFVPRPIHFVDALPRNATGKLTDAILRAAIAAAVSRASDPARSERRAR